MTGLIIPIILTIAIRIIYWVQVHDEAWFIAPGTDPAFYLDWARAILAGKGSLFIPFPRAPLYPYLLAGIQHLFGTGWLWLRLPNLLADICTVSLIYRLTCKISGKRTAIISSSLFALSGAAIYFTGEILMTSLATALFMVFLTVFINIYNKPHVITAIITGLLIGVISLLRPNMLALLPFTVAIIAVHCYKTRVKPIRTTLLSASHLIAAIVILIPVTITNWQTTHQLIPVSQQGGVNFYIGNARGAAGWASWLPGAGATWTDEDAHRIAEEYAGKPLKTSEVSSQLWLKGFHEIMAAPFSWMRLMLKKTLLLVNYREIGNNRPLSLAKEASPMLRWLFPVSIGLMLPFAMVGFLAIRKQRNAQLLLILGSLYAATLLIFFITSRYRMPLTPVFCIFAGIGISAIIDSIRNKKTEISIITALVIGAVIAIPNWAGDKYEEPVQAEYIAGNALMRVGRVNEAIARYEKARQMAPNFPELHLNYGAALMETGNLNAAKIEFQAELENNPHSAKAMNNLGVIEEKSGSIYAAQQYYQEAFETAPHLEDARINLVRIYRMQTLSNPNDPKPWYGMAVVAGMVGDWRNAKSMLKESLKRNPKYQPAVDLLREINLRE